MTSLADLETELLFLVLSNLPECPSVHRWLATCACNGLRAVRPLIAAYDFPLSSQINAIWAVGEDDEDVLHAQAAAAVTLSIPGEVYLDFDIAPVVAAAGSLELRGNCAVDGLATVWARWSSPLGPLCSVVLGWRVRAPGDPLDHCTVGVCKPELLRQLEGGRDVNSALAASDVGSCLAVTSFAAGSAANLHCGGELEETLDTLPTSECVHEVSSGSIVLAVSNSELRVAIGDQRFVVLLTGGQRVECSMVPFVALSTKGFGGFEYLEQDDLPVCVQALTLDEARREASDIFPRNGLPF